MVCISFLLINGIEAQIVPDTIPIPQTYKWAKGVGFGETFEDEGRAITTGAMDYMYTTGYFGEIADFDPDAVGNHDLISAGGKDTFISKLDTNGNFVAAINMGGSSPDEGKSIALDAAGNIDTVGFFKGTVDFDPDAMGNQRRTSAGNVDIFISKLDASGNFIWAKSMGGDGNDNGYGTFVTPSFDVYTTGDFMDEVNFDTETGIDYIESFGDFDIFIHKLSPDSGIAVPIGISNIPLVFPNPSTQSLALDLGRSYNTVTLKVINSNGELVSTKAYKEMDRIDFDINDSPSMYIVEVMADGEKKQALKVIKQ